MSVNTQIRNYRRRRSGHFRKHGSDPRIAMDVPLLHKPGAKIIHVTNKFAEECREFETENGDDEVDVPSIPDLVQRPVERMCNSYQELLKVVAEPPVVIGTREFFLYDKIVYKGKTLHRYCYRQSLSQLGATYEDVYKFVGFARIESVRGFMSVKVRKGKVQESFLAPLDPLLGRSTRRKKLIPMETLDYLIQSRKLNMA